MDAIDVATGLAVVVRAQDFTLIYDAGSNDDLETGTSNRALRFLQHVEPSLTTVDHLILSHPHRDHAELMADIIGSYTVRHVWDSGRLHDICGYRLFLEAVERAPAATFINDQPGGVRLEVVVLAIVGALIGLLLARRASE